MHHQAPHSAKEEILAALQSTLQAGVDAGIPGLSAAISASHSILWQSTAGSANLENRSPLNKNHLFGIGSITKVFVTVIILQLVDENRVQLSDTVGDLLDEEVYRGIENAETATVEGLLSHTAGVESWEDDPVWIVEGRGAGLDPERIWGKKETLGYIRRPNPSGPKPGQFSYSNTNFTLLGLIIEKITRQTAESEIRRRILRLCDMRETYLEGFEQSQLERLPHRYHWATETFRKIAGLCPRFSEPQDGLIDATPSNLSVEWVAGGMLSSPTDLLKFAVALRDDRLLSPSSMRILKDWQSARENAEMGHGLFRFSSPLGHGKWLGHNGSVLGFTGALWWKEEGDCAICVLANVGTMHAGEVPSSAPHVAMNSEFMRLASELAAL